LVGVFEISVDDLTQRPIFKKYFEKSADELLAQYEKSKGLEASANKGSAREVFCRDFLRKNLPSRLSVKSGEIWDGEGSRTGQFEIIIIRDDCPTLSYGGPDVFPIEGVFGVVEVKSVLKPDKLHEALNQLRKVRLLKPMSGGGGSYGPYLLKPLCCVFAYEGSMQSALEELKKHGNSDIVDLLCVLKDGVLIWDTSLLVRPGHPPDVEPLLTEVADKPIVVRGKAASLGFLWYYLVSYSASFIGQSMEFQRYFRPLTGW
jgi:hypothetical protein